MSQIPPIYTPPIRGSRQRFRLRPLGLGEILDEALDLYRRNFFTLVKIIAIPALPLFLVSVFFAAIFYPRFNALIGSMNNNLSPQRALEVVGSAFLALFILIPIWYICITIQNGASSLAISEAYLGKKIIIKDVLQKVVSRSPSLIGAQLLVAFGVTVLVVALFVGVLILFAAIGYGFHSSPEAIATLSVLTGVVMALFCGFLILGVMAWFLFIPMAVMIEKKNVFDGINRSIELVKGVFFRVLGTYIVVIVVVTILNYILQQVFILPLQIYQFAGAVTSASKGFGLFFILSIAVSNIVQMLTMPFVNACLTLLYYDLRIRKEGFDIEMLTLEMGYGESPRAQLDY